MAATGRCLLNLGDCVTSSSFGLASGWDFALGERADVLFVGVVGGF